jgi:hypothetical protein
MKTRRRALISCLVLGALLCGSVQSPAHARGTTWRDTKWYGWISLHVSGSETGENINDHGMDVVQVIRASGSHLSIVQTSGNFWGEAIDCDYPSYQATITGPGKFGEEYAGGVLVVDRGGTKYTLGTPGGIPSVVQETDTWGAGCAGGTSTYSTTVPYFMDFGCGTFHDDTFKATPCTTSNTKHLKGHADYVDTYSYGSYETVADWNLVSNPVNDPCLATPTPAECGTDLRTATVSDSGDSGDLGSTCGKATFDWREVTGERSPVHDGEGACVFLVGNKLAQLLLKVAADTGVPIGSAFAGTVLHGGVVKYTGKTTIWAEKWLAKKTLLRAIARALGESLPRFTPIVAIGEAVALTAIPLAVGFLVGQIKNHNACVQVVVDKDSGKLKVDWSLVYAHASDSSLTSAHVYKKHARSLRPDTYTPVGLGMQCNGDGTVSVDAGSSKAMNPRVTAYVEY